MCAQLKEIGYKLVTVGWKSVAAGCKLEASSRARMPAIKAIPARRWGNWKWMEAAGLGRERWEMLWPPVLDLTWGLGSWERGLPAWLLCMEM